MTNDLDEEFWAKVEGYITFDDWAKSKNLDKETRQIVAMYIQKEELK